MKKISCFIVAILVAINITISVSANEIISPPIADVYKEGIYHFKAGSGRIMMLEIVDEHKPMTLIIIDDETKKTLYYINFGDECKKIDITLDNPLKSHTTVMLGDGELSFKFEK